MSRLVLIPGFQDTGAAWGSVVAQLDVPPWQPTPITLREADASPDVRGRVLEGYRDQVLATVEDLEPTGPVVVVGHSLGAQIAELVTIALGERATALVLITPIPLMGFALTDDQKASFAASARERTPESAAKGRNTLLVNDSATVVGMLVEGTLATPPDLAAQELRAWSGGHPVGDGPSPVGAPVLVIGGDDHFVSEEMVHDVIATRFADVRIARIRGAGHWPHVEQPGAIAAVLNDFIQTVSLTDGTNQS